jgi:hypothetical protein
MLLCTSHRLVDRAFDFLLIHGSRSWTKLTEGPRQPAVPNEPPRQLVEKLSRVVGRGFIPGESANRISMGFSP